MKTRCWFNRNEIRMGFRRELFYQNCYLLTPLYKHTFDVVLPEVYGWRHLKLCTHFKAASGSRKLSLNSKKQQVDIIWINTFCSGLYVHIFLRSVNIDSKCIYFVLRLVYVFDSNTFKCIKMLHCPYLSLSLFLCWCPCRFPNPTCSSAAVGSTCVRLIVAIHQVLAPSDQGWWSMMVNG